MTDGLTLVCDACGARWLVPSGIAAADLETAVCSDCAGKLRAPRLKDEHRPAFPLGISLKERMEMLRETRNTHPSFGARHAAAQEMLRLAGEGRSNNPQGAK